MEALIKNKLKNLRTFRFTEWILLLFWGVTIICIAFFTERYEHLRLFIGLGLSFGIYFYLSINALENNLRAYLVVAVLIRFILIFSFPKLSDDIYRFIWDGRCWVNGIHPFQYTPAQLLPKSIPGLDQELFQKLNSPNYYSIYPLICQIAFYLSSFASPNNIFLNALLIKVFLFACELITLSMSLKILSLNKLPASRILWYLLNPMILLEICGNAHFEGAMVAFLSVAIYYFMKKKSSYSALFFSLSVASKMLTALFYPLLAFVEIAHKKLKFILQLVLFTVLLSIPLFLNLNILDSLNLYFNKFEYNASMYYLLRWVGIKLTGYNQIATIGPVLSIISTICIILWSFLGRHKTKPTDTMLWILTIYLIFATTVHPWYLTTLLFLAIFNKYYYPIIWTSLIMLTYLNYGYDTFKESILVVFIEYFVVFAMIIYETELLKKLKLKWIQKN